MRCPFVFSKIEGNTHIRHDLRYNFVTQFDCKSGFYARSNVLDSNFNETDEEPFMASFPHLLDVGVMGHCIHGKSGLCQAAGIQCYQSGPTQTEPNMPIEDFSRICEESEGLLDQIALGGRGDPDCHESFKGLLEVCKKHHIVPNFTTSGFLMNEEKAALCAQYCGAVAVSWYRSPYTIKAIETLLKAGVKTNIQYVVDSHSIDEAIRLLETDGFPKGVNGVLFLLFKPVGLGQKKNILRLDNEKLQPFFDAACLPHPFKVGFDSCFVPGLLNYAHGVVEESFDTGEGGRFSMYISPSMVALPCSFDQKRQYAFDLRGKDLYDAWVSPEFERFRSHLRQSCPNCPKQTLCLGGCPLEKDIVLCQERQKP